MRAVEPGHLYRVRLLPAGRFLFVRPGASTLTTSGHSFTPFVLHGNGSFSPISLVDLSYGRPLQVGETGHPRRIALAPSPRAKRRRIHWNLEYPSPPLPPPPPPPPPLRLATASIAAAEHAFRLRRGGRGESYSLGLRDDRASYVIDDGEGRSFSALKLGGKPLSKHASSSRRPASFGFEALDAGLAPGRGLAHAIEQSRIKRGGRQLVVATAYGSRFALQRASLFWDWLAFSRIRRAILLSPDGATCAATRVITRNSTARAHCVGPDDLSLPAEVTRPGWGGESVPAWETRANLPQERFLRRCKLQLLGILVQRGIDVVFLDPDVLVIGPSFLEVLVRNTTSDLAIASDPQSGFTEQNTGHCLRIPSMYSLRVADWVAAGQFYLRATKAAAWFVDAAKRLMDETVISDADAMQALLSGHAQVSDPRVASRRRAAGGAAAASVWLKPLWLEAEVEPYRGRGLSNQRWIRPINAPLGLAAWRSSQAEAHERGFTWQRLPEAAFVTTAATLRAGWADGFGKPKRGDGAAARALSVKVSCQLASVLDEESNSASFLLRPGLV